MRDTRSLRESSDHWEEVDNSLRFGYGQYLKVDGKIYVGIEREPHVKSILGKGSGRRNAVSPLWDKLLGRGRKRDL